MDSLPAEILLQVLDHLEEDPRDVLNASESFGPFDDLLGAKVDECRLEEVLPHVFKWLRVKDILACRQTCKRIQGSVDGILDNLEQLSEHRNMELIRSRFNPPQLSRSFEWSRFHHLHSKVGVALGSLQRIVQFREEMEASPENGRPIVGKRLSMSKRIIWRANYSRDLLDAGIQLMAQFQTRLAHVNLNAGKLDTSAVETYGLLRRVFLAVPNLHSFRAAMIDEWNPVESDDLQQFISQHPLPLMPLLKRISFLEYTVATSVYQEMASKYRVRLECLQLDFSDQSSLHEYPEHLSGAVQRFPALVEMRIRLSWRMRDLLLKMQAPSLVHLKLALLPCVYPPSPPPMSILQFIQIFKSFPNLVDLDLRLLLPPDGLVPFGRNGQRQAFRDGLNNRHPNLKRLKLTASVALLYFPMEFWLELFPKLEYFRINVLFRLVSRWGGVELPYPDYDLNLFVWERGYDSKLWRMGGASLQTVHIIREIGNLNLVYTRKGYERGRLEQSSCSVM